MDLKQAYEILGVPESANRDEVEKQYAVWVRKDRAAKRGMADSDESIQFAKVNEAYKMIIDHFYELENQDKPQRNPRVEKLDHFWTYYKFHVIGAIILIIGIAYIINTVVENQQEKARLAQLPPPNATMMMYGDFFEPDIEGIESGVLAAKPDWERVVVGHTYLPSSMNDPYAIALQQKAMVTLVTDRSDVYMIDQHNMQVLVNQELFRPLDEYEDRLKASVGEENLIYARTMPSGLDPDEQPGEIHLYLIRLPISDLYSSLADEIMAGIHVSSENIENALQMIETLVNDL